MTSGRNAALAGVGVGAIGTWLLTNRAKAAPAGVDPELWEAFQTLIGAIALQTQEISALIALLSSGDGAFDPAFANLDKFTTGQVLCPIIGSAVALPSIIIPRGKQLVLKALPNNADWIYVGQIAVDSQNLVIAWILVPNEGFGLYIKNASHVYVTAQAVNDGINYAVEQ